MDLYIEYFKFANDPELLTMFPDVAGNEDDSAYIYSDDGTTKTLLGFKNLSNTVPLIFNVDGDENSYVFSFDFNYGLVFFAQDTNQSFTTIPYKVIISSKFIELFKNKDWDLNSTSLLQKNDFINHLDLMNQSYESYVLSAQDAVNENINTHFDSQDENLNSITIKIDTVGDIVKSDVIASKDAILSLVDSSKDSILTAISNIEVDIPDQNFTFASLNGSAGSYPDGTSVVVSGITGIFTVVSSQMLKNDENQYIVVYKLEKDGRTSLFPSVMVSVSGS